MDLLLEYLKDKEEELYPEEPEDAVEEPEDDYGLDFVDDATFVSPVLDVEETPDNSDPVLDADEFMYSNSDPLSYYSRGNGINLADNSDLYEVIKLVKDVTDKHLYMRDMTWKVNIANRSANFIFRLGDEDDTDTNGFFLQGVQQYIVSELWKRYGPFYDVNAEFLKNDNGADIMNLTVKRKDEDSIYC